MTRITSLGAYVHTVHAEIARACERAPLCSEHRARIDATVRLPRARAHENPEGDPLALLYLVARARGRAVDQATVLTGAAYMLYVLALDLFDDVQDDDLEGKPYAAATRPIAINGGITLLFLAYDTLRRAVGEQPLRAGRDLLSAFSATSLLAVAGQELDLLGQARSVTRDEVIRIQRAKTSSVTLAVTCGAILGGFHRAERRALEGFGRDLASFVQIRDDLRDIFGKAVSPDLAARTPTYPIACMLEHEDDEVRLAFARLAEMLPSSLPDIRELFYRSGVVERCAVEMERLRTRMHRRIAADLRPGPELRAVLSIVDGLAASVYRPSAVPASRALFEPQTGWHRLVRAEVRRFCERMAPAGFTEAPRLVPWSRPHWMYLSGEGVIFYPDVEGMPEETLRFQAHLLGTRRLDRVVELVRRQLPAVVAHELFHCWRDRAGRLSGDHWHEEWAANRLAVAYLSTYEPETLAATAALAAKVMGRLAARWEAPVAAVLARCEVAGADDDGYGMDVEGVAVATLAMVGRLAETPSRLDIALADLLGNRSTPVETRTPSREACSEASRRRGRRGVLPSKRMPSSPSSRTPAADSRTRRASAR